MMEREKFKHNSKMAAATFGSGTTNTLGTGFSFGGTTTGGTGPVPFGSSTPRASGFSAIKPLGIATTTANTSGLFATPAATKTTTGISFGATGTQATSASTGLSFGQLGNTSTSTLTAFGQPSTTSAPTGISFGQPTSSTGLSLGASSGLTLGGLQATTTTSGLFGAKPATTTSSLFSGANTSALGFGGLGTLGAKSTVATTTTVTGLGGTGSSSTLLSGATNGNTNKQGELQNLKDSPLPDKLNEIVEHIKKYVKEQKEHRDEISRYSASTMHKVREDTIAQRQLLAVVLNSIQRDGCSVENLKMDVAQELKNAEICQRTSDIPPALQHENTLPQEYFHRLVESFEERMQVYKKQIDIMESHLCSLSQGHTLTPQDLSQVMHHVHETFIALAAELHSIHEAVKIQKEHFLNYRKAYFKDPTDVFTVRQWQVNKPNPDLGVGPSPFNTTGNTASLATVTNQASATNFLA
ncbi:nucleoporin p58/p45 isoform X2 [Nematostella vectensis]|uniref:nucleoporin p58/p45 isoform X2 n=1 Tax=Nematostella vectensis TaxID=45351 RepID=UPI00138FF7C5|nr:nucleoporin p58/p45 isoform X2 [Nematostella vectensis]